MYIIRTPHESLEETEFRVDTWQEAQDQYAESLACVWRDTGDVDVLRGIHDIYETKDPGGYAGPIYVAFIDDENWVITYEPEVVKNKGGYTLRDYTMDCVSQKVSDAEGKAAQQRVRDYDEVVEWLFSNRNSSLFWQQWRSENFSDVSPGLVDLDEAKAFRDGK
jgi:hypothetical protein